ncbi:MAG: tRNA (guanine-N1)-methyltransferase [Flavobacteriaceae bacterium]|nr:tRNA (guanine-N1)-methyltransferase [Flavobacteriaceae bacterium]
MKTLKFLALTLILVMSSNSLYAQDNETQSINEGSINDQFEYILRKSGNFKGTNGQQYEAVSRNLLLALQSHANDSLKTIREDLNKTLNTVEVQQKEISDLKSRLNTTQSTLDATNQEKNNMALLGLQMSKTSYNILMWSIIAGLLALLLMFIFKFKNSNSITKAAKKALAETEEEFEEHRRSALEREQKVRRQLQDELNKQKGIS